MDTYENMSYDKFLVTIVQNQFIPMCGFNFQNPATKKMSYDYHISANLDKGLFLTSESHNHVLYESRLYYELNMSKISNDSEAINCMLDLLESIQHLSCGDSDTKLVLPIKYDASKGLISHLNKLNHKKLFINNPWKNFEKHNLEIIMLDEDRIKMPGYHKNNSWINELPKEARYMIGYK